MTVFTDLEQIILKCVRNHKRSRIPKTILRKNEVRDITLPDPRPYYKATVIETAWYWQNQKNEQTKKQTYGLMQQKREPRNKPTHLWSLLFDKGGKNIQWKKRQSLQQVVLGKLDS